MSTHAMFSTYPSQTTAAVRARLSDVGVDMTALLDRHARGDWGEINLDEEQENGLSLVCGGPVVSQFKLSGTDGVRIVTDTLRKTTWIGLTTEPHGLTRHAGHSLGVKALAA